MVVFLPKCVTKVLSDEVRVIRCDMVTFFCCGSIFNIMEDNYWAVILIRYCVYRDLRLIKVSL